MSTIFDPNTRLDLIYRIQYLDANSQRQWGKMNVYQMITHCQLCDEMYQGKKLYKRSLIGFIIGRFALRQLMNDDKPKKRNSPTKSEFKNLEPSGNLEATMVKWIETINDYENYNNPNFIHWFFGRMTKEQVGISAYKHIEHHLKQFNC
jgi:predicted transcriptional regulator